MTPWLKCYTIDMFVDLKTAQRMERAEAAGMRAMAEPLVGSARARAAFVHELSAGVAAYVRAGSPLNKVIGVGLQGVIEGLEELERRHVVVSEPVRVEIATLATPESFEQLATRGYRLLGFENVLARSLHGVSASAASDVRVERVTDATRDAYRHAMVEGFAQADDTGVVLDQFTRTVIETVFDDVLQTPHLARYVAYRGDALAGGASMFVHEGVAVLTGSATLAQHRRHGVQATLLATRLADAHAAGAKLAMITAAPGTQSQANVTKLGFALAYARAVLVLTTQG